MNPALYTYAQLQARHHLPGLRRALGKIDREIESFERSIESLTRRRQFAHGWNETHHRPFTSGDYTEIIFDYREVLKTLFVKREQLLSAIETITKPRYAARPLSAEARRAIAELPGTQKVNLSLGQRALCLALGHEPSLTGKNQPRKRKNRMARLIAAA